MGLVICQCGGEYVGFFRKNGKEQVATFLKKNAYTTKKVHININNDPIEDN